MTGKKLKYYILTIFLFLIFGLISITIFKFIQKDKQNTTFNVINLGDRNIENQIIITTPDFRGTAAFIRNNQIYLLDKEKTLKQLTHTKIPSKALAFSPQGDKIAFVFIAKAEYPNPILKFNVISLTGNSEKGFEVSPGRDLALSNLEELRNREWHICTVYHMKYLTDSLVELSGESCGGIEFFQVVNLNTGKTEKTYMGLDSSWNSQAMKVAYKSVVFPLHFAPEWLYSNSLQIDGELVYPKDYVLGEKVAIIHDFQGEFVWSPDGQQVAFVDQYEETGESFLVIVNSETNEIIQLLLSKNGQVLYWSNNQEILIKTDDNLYIKANLKKRKIINDYRLNDIEVKVLEGLDRQEEIESEFKNVYSADAWAFWWKEEKIGEEKSSPEP